MIDVTLQNFEADVLQASTRAPVLLDVWAEWCGPCKQLGPVLEQLETEYAGRFILAKLDADKVPQIAGQLSQMLGVRSIPLCVLFVGGQPVDAFVGAQPPAQIRQFLADFFKAGADHLARAAPFGPEIDDDGGVGLHDFGIELRVRNGSGGHCAFS